MYIFIPEMYIYIYIYIHMRWLFEKYLQFVRCRVQEKIQCFCDIDQT